MLNTSAHRMSKLTAELVDALSLTENAEPAWGIFLRHLLDNMNVQGGRLVLVEGQESFSLCEIASPAWNLHTHCFQLDDAELYLELYIDSGMDISLVEQSLNWLSEGLNGILNLAYQFQKARRLRQVSLQYEERLGFARYGLNDKGEVIDCNVSGEQLIDDGVVRLFRKRVQVPTDESWVKLSLNDLQEKPNELASYKTIHTTKGVYHCILLMIKENEKIWLKSQSRFLLIMVPALQNFDDQKLQEVMGLSQAEASIASWFATGLTAAEVANKTGYKTSTVYSYIKKLYSNLGINKQPQLTALLLRTVPVI